MMRGSTAVRGAIVVVLALTAFILCFGFAMRVATGQDNCEGWISHSCCCTNDCCFVVKPGTVKAIDADNYLIVASGQVIQRTDWSKNGEFMRCACDQNEFGKWVIHDKAKTRCIYPPAPSM